MNIESFFLGLALSVVLTFALIGMVVRHKDDR